MLYLLRTLLVGEWMRQPIFSRRCRSRTSFLGRPWLLDSQTWGRWTKRENCLIRQPGGSLAQPVCPNDTWSEEVARRKRRAFTAAPERHHRAYSSRRRKLICSDLAIVLLYSTMQSPLLHLRNRRRASFALPEESAQVTTLKILGFAFFPCTVQRLIGTGALSRTV
ncbi:uncharacterized protein LOC126410135 [Nymphaea colorata]|uniref:uncharacterized protein LOC126410135 n=1 Tax=Nymphaea colorata TaxID=210225 RepID=UPI00214E4157|nr:uncharacterized protein LOC126410135 [Nymphaea colorata]